MRNKSLIIAALIFGSTFVAFGNENPGNTGFAIVPAKGNHVFKVIYKSEVASRVKVSVYNSNGSVVFADNLSAVTGFMLPLNFSGLPAGEYTVVVSDVTGKRIEKIHYQPKSNIRQVHISKVSAEAGKYLVAIANTGEETVSINILNEENALIHSERRTINGDFAQLYKIDANAGSYTFQVVDQAGNIKAIKF